MYGMQCLRGGACASVHFSHDRKETFAVRATQNAVLLCFSNVRGARAVGFYKARRDFAFPAKAQVFFLDSAGTLHFLRVRQHEVHGTWRSRRKALPFLRRQRSSCCWVLQDRHGTVPFLCQTMCL